MRDEDASSLLQQHANATGSRVPARVDRHARPDQAHAAGPVRRSRCALGRAVPARPAAVGHGRRLHYAQARRQQGRHRLPAPRPEATCSRKPTASSCTRSRSCRSRRFSPATRSAAPTCCAVRWARRSPRKWRSSARSFVTGRDRTRCVPKRPTATRIFDLMEKFAGYGFNKSHSAAYAVLAYQTAYLKAHYRPHSWPR